VAAESSYLSVCIAVSPIETRIVYTYRGIVGSCWPRYLSVVANISVRNTGAYENTGSRTPTQWSNIYLHSNILSRSRFTSTPCPRITHRGFCQFWLLLLFPLRPQWDIGLAARVFALDTDPAHEINNNTSHSDCRPRNRRNIGSSTCRPCVPLLSRDEYICLQ
jgi:hypothetical protein